MDTISLALPAHCPWGDPLARGPGSRSLSADEGPSSRRKWAPREAGRAERAPYPICPLPLPCPVQNQWVVALGGLTSSSSEWGGVCQEEPSAKGSLVTMTGREAGHGWPGTASSLDLEKHRPQTFSVLVRGPREGPRRCGRMTWKGRARSSHGGQGRAPRFSEAPARARDHPAEQGRARHAQLSREEKPEAPRSPAPPLADNSAQILI